MGDRGAVVLVHLDSPPLVGAEPQRLESELGGGALAPGGVQHRVAEDLLATFEGGANQHALDGDAGYLLAQAKGDPLIP
jgi:hypothetical protein